MDKDKKIEDLKDKFANFELKKQPRRKPGRVSKQDREYIKKLDEERYDLFTHKDWAKYFAQKYEKVNNFPYHVVTKDQALRENAIFKSVLDNFNPRDLKLMIDFIFDSNQDIKEKEKAGSYLLSKNWLPTIYQEAKLWENGKYKPSKEKNRVKRESGPTKTHSDLEEVKPGIFW